MRHHSIGIDEDDGTGWRLMAQLPAVRKIECALMVGAAQCADRYAAPAAGDQSMDVAGEDVADIAVAPENVMEGIGVGEPDLVKHRHVDPERRVVHEEENRPVTRFLQLVVQPAQPCGAQPALDMSGVQRVEQDQVAIAAIENALDEPALGRRFREHLKKSALSSWLPSISRQGGTNPASACLNAA